jgi:hypothetical protein
MRWIEDRDTAVSLPSIHLHRGFRKMVGLQKAQPAWNGFAQKYQFISIYPLLAR